MEKPDLSLRLARQQLTALMCLFARFTSWPVAIALLLGFVYLLAGITPPDGTRRFRDDKGAGQSSAVSLINVTDGVDYEGQASFRIVTQNATYYYHKQGAGFARMEDKDGNDWIGFRPFGGAEGKYRGIPNLVHPEGYFHPGGTECVSRVTSSGPVKVTIHSESKDQKWAVKWDVYPTYATLTVLKAERPYWFLYEGSLAGKLEPDKQYIVRFSGQRTSAAERWDGDMPGPEWLYFGDVRMKRVLYLIHHEDDQAIDSYWPMQGQMTVFGFGRQGLKKFMDAVPNRFTIGFAEDAATAPAVIDSVIEELRTTAGARE